MCLVHPAENKMALPAAMPCCAVAHGTLLLLLLLGSCINGSTAHLPAPDV
jgi:hypothetical protein